MVAVFEPKDLSKRSKKKIPENSIKDISPNHSENSEEK